jgi:hypothetical protein
VILPTDANTIPAVKHHLITIPLDPENSFSTRVCLDSS